MHQSLQKPLSVAVIGGGISGLICARTLADHNFRVKVFDKAPEPGGRMSTLCAGGFSFDHGAQYFTVRNSNFRPYVDSWITDGLVAEWNGRICVLENGLVSKPSGETGRYVAIPAMSSIAKSLSNGCDFRKEIEVSRVQKKKNQWLLLSKTGENLGNYDVAVAATPAPEAAKLLSEVPNLAERAALVKMFGCWAVMLAFSKPLDLPFDGAFVHGSALSWIARNSSKVGRSSDECWILHSTPEWADEHIDNAPEQVIGLLIDAFSRATACREIAPSFAAAYCWRYATPLTPLDERCLYDPLLAMGACGDWCAGPRVEGAFLSGLAIAGRILEREKLNHRGHREQRVL